jgi:hypothetical protein
LSINSGNVLVNVGILYSYKLNVAGGVDVDHYMRPYLPLRLISRAGV